MASTDKNKINDPNNTKNMIHFRSVIWNKSKGDKQWEKNTMAESDEEWIFEIMLKLF